MSQNKPSEAMSRSEKSPPPSTVDPFIGHGYYPPTTKPRPPLKAAQSAPGSQYIPHVSGRKDRMATRHSPFRALDADAKAELDRAKSVEDMEQARSSRTWGGSGGSIASRHTQPVGRSYYHPDRIVRRAVKREERRQKAFFGS